MDHSVLRTYFQGLVFSVHQAGPLSKTVASVTPAHVFRSPDLGSAVNFEETQNGRRVVASTVHLVFPGSGSRALSQRQTPTRTDKLHRQAAPGISPLSSVHNSLSFFFFIAGTLENRVGGAGGGINKRRRKSDGAIAMRQPVSSIPLLPLVPRLPTLTPGESG